VQGECSAVVKYTARVVQVACHGAGCCYGFVGQHDRPCMHACLLSLLVELFESKRLCLLMNSSERTILSTCVFSTLCMCSCDKVC
jgi:hypothetical protein